MANWAVSGIGIEGDSEGKSFKVALDTDNKKWTATGPSVDQFFKTKSGSYNIGALPELGTQLLNSSSKEVMFFKNLTGASAVGATGTGRASEKGVDFAWKLDSK